ncbi:hypothetical protein [Mycobacterium asiaticum]|uniref:hypothetical protein n=1 Tax=Mycobacterium asiaticum TaxID=1790 RepID=UPI0012DB764A|nr:hypothetical protein [Mycobacterium asiaticum]
MPKQAPDPDVVDGTVSSAPGRVADAAGGVDAMTAQADVELCCPLKRFEPSHSAFA